MSDRYAQLVNNPVGSVVARRVGLPLPQRSSARSGDPVIRGRVLLGGAPGGRLASAVAATLAGARRRSRPRSRSRCARPSRTPARCRRVQPRRAGEQRFKGLIFDATGIGDSTELALMHAFFHASVGRIERCGRMIVLATPPSACGSPREATAQRAIEGFTRSLGKEVGGAG